ncbi:hypothetical protein [Aliihoeflea sp. 40Bstr573]|uniref:hypothetical protein n=1 Tax=Aliihoeflea sp. 40Bstr573 TaxID=2696467 RepID=UPI0020957415|nr:hypothetical protein [Aliihoeflea sp. 40Bstr573]MCO6387940.1 hypothetical protein [Aliihoeflea sp. 40Bstr573]
MSHPLAKRFPETAHTLATTVVSFDQAARILEQMAAAAPAATAALFSKGYQTIEQRSAELEEFGGSAFDGGHKPHANTNPVAEIMRQQAQGK